MTTGALRLKGGEAFCWGGVRGRSPKPSSAKALGKPPDSLLLFQSIKTALNMPWKVSLSQSLLCPGDLGIWAGPAVPGSPAAFCLFSSRSCGRNVLGGRQHGAGHLHPRSCHFLAAGGRLCLRHEVGREGGSRVGMHSHPTCPPSFWQLFPLEAPGRSRADPRRLCFLSPSDAATIPACGCPSCIRIHTAKSRWRRSLIIQFTRRG